MINIKFAFYFFQSAQQVTRDKVVFTSVTTRLTDKTVPSPVIVQRNYVITCLGALTLALTCQVPISKNQNVFILENNNT